MTDYGRGPGSEPWNPEDPLYGDLGYGGQQAPQAPPAHDGRQQYRTQQQAVPQQYDAWGNPQQSQDPYQAQAQYQAADATGQYPTAYPPQYPAPDPGGQYQPQDGGAYGTGQYPAQGGTGQYPTAAPGAYPQDTGQYPAADGYTQHHTGQYPAQDGTGQYPVQGGGTGQFPTQGAPGQYLPQGHPQHDTSGQYPVVDAYQAGYPPAQDTGWDTGAHGVPPYGDPYGGTGGNPQYPGPGYQGPGYEQGPPQDPYGDGAGPPGAVPPGGPDPYGAPQPGPPRPAGRRRPEPEPEPEPDPETGWDPGPDQGEHAFFADPDDDEDDFVPEREGRRGRKGRGGDGTSGGRKRRSGAACLVVTLVLGGGIGIVGYFGYQFYEDKFGPPPDFAGGGSGTVTVVIPEGASGYTIGQKLKDAGVVKSVDAFVAAQKKNPKGQSIQDGAYSLHKEMSAANAVSLMLDGKSRNALIIAEGRRNSWVYEQIDKRLGLKAGTTKDIARKDISDFGLPDWAKNHKNVKDPLEGFLYPSSYAVAKGMKPQDVLQQMVNRAKAAYSKAGLEAEAKKFHLDGPWQVITAASLVQAEGKTDDDFRKMAEVIYNRLDPKNTETNGLIEFDSTYNYAMNRSDIHISVSEINNNHDKYNTYTSKGLPPGPIGNPGKAALDATLDPTHDGWFYFVATDGENKTEFAKNYADFQKLKDKFNEQSGN